nr:rhomboid-related protein 2-like [Onthophagus taurus]XP_022901829.1 rhomboid-related protein 2-like [Onthophagus taurus]
MKIEKDSSIFFTEDYLSILFNKIPPNEYGIITYRQLHDFIQVEDDLLPKRLQNVFKNVAETKGEDEINQNDFIKLVMNEKYCNKFEKYLNIYMSFLIPPPPPTDFQIEKQDFQIEKQSNLLPLRRVAFQIQPTAFLGGGESYESEYDIKFIPSLQTAKMSVEDMAETPQRIYHFWPLPLAMILISLTEIVLYIIDAAHGLNWRNGIISNELIYNPSRRIEMWRYLTYMFVHAGSWHLSMNILFQLSLGIPLELHYTWWPIILVYCCGVISGALGSSVMDGFAWLAGASGGVYALLMAHVVSIIMNWKRIYHRKFLLIFLLTFILVDILRVVIDYSTGNLNHTISYSSHFFGGLSGVLIGTVIFKQFTPEGERKALTYILVIIFVILFGLAVFYNIFFTTKFPK